MMEGEGMYIIIIIIIIIRPSLPPSVHAGMHPLFI